MKSNVTSEPIATVEPRVLTICAYVEFAPFAFERDGEIAGTDIALLKYFAAGERLAVSIRKHDFMDLWKRPGAGECDVAAAGITALSERDLGACGVWSTPYMTVLRSLLIRQEDAERLKSPLDFRGRKIVVTPHSTADFDARWRYQPLGAEIIGTVPTQQAVVRALLHNEIDAFAQGDVTNEYLARQFVDGAGHSRLALADIHPLDPIETLHFAVRAIDPRLVERLNAFIATWTPVAP